MRLTHIDINIISEAHSYLRTMSVRLSHTWVIIARLTHSYMYAGYRLGGGGGGGGGSLASIYYECEAHSHLSCHSAVEGSLVTTVGSDTETSLYVHAVGFSTGWVRD